MRTWLYIAACVAAASLAAAASAEDVAVRAAVEKTDAFVGEPFIFQIQVQGNDHPDAPDVSALSNDFDVQTLGGQTNNSQSVTVVNGRMSTTVQRAYVFNYRLSPKRTGVLNIPAMTLTVDGKAMSTQPIQLTGRKPEETQDFKFRLELSSERCYAGEPVALTITWYLRKDVRNFSFTLPILEDNRFVIEESTQPPDPRRELVRFPLGSQECIGEKGTDTLDGLQYTTLLFRKILIPRQAGTYDFPPATVACEARVGDQRRGARGLFGDIFDNDPFFGQRGMFKSFVTPSNPLHLQVAEVPQQGRPANYSGLVGSYELDVSAAPTEVNVGDPITLTIRISGPPYLKAVELPPLENQPELAKHFKIPKEMAAGKIEGNAKVFAQTVRAQDASVTEIPPIVLSYFDSKIGSYQEARSAPIPLIVHANRVVTADQAEGTAVAKVQNQLTQWKAGIAHNYEDFSALTDQAYGAGLWMCSAAGLTVLGLPPLAYAGLAGFVFVRRRGLANPALRRSKRAHAELAQRLRAIDQENPAAAYGVLLESLQAYLGAKLGLSAAALTYEDAAAPLTQRGADDALLLELREIFQECEASQYAGQSSDAGVRALAERTLALAAALEKGALR